MKRSFVWNVRRKKGVGDIGFELKYNARTQESRRIVDSGGIISTS